MLYLFAAMFGFGYGGEVALISPLAADMFGMKKHGTILGVVTSAYYLGSAIGPSVAGRIYDIAGNYSLAFLISAIFSVVGLLLVLPLKPPRGKVSVLQS